MDKKIDRRSFLTKSALTGAGAGLAFGFEEKNLLAQSEPPGQIKIMDGADDFPTGRIGDKRLSRVICGGNLTSGFAHSRDLIYVSSLLKNYFTDEKIFETWQLCQLHGIDTVVLHICDHTMRLIDTYHKQYSDKLQFIAQCKVQEHDLMSEIQQGIDNGAIGAHVQGACADKLVIHNQVEVIARAVEKIKENGLIAGVAGHMLDVPVACEGQGVDADYYMKTINSKSYWSAGPMPRRDSVWSETPELTIDFMETVNKPWIGYKVLGAGAIKPYEGFKYAFENGTDFICVGMFDFQIAEDAKIAKELFASKFSRKRPWCG